MTQFKTGILVGGVIYYKGRKRFLQGFSDKIIYAYELADDISLTCYDIEVVVTSAGGESHTPDSKHYGRKGLDGRYYIEAVDIRSRHYTKEQGDEFIVELRARLGDEFKVLDERETKRHIHIQYEGA